MDVNVQGDPSTSGLEFSENLRDLPNQIARTPSVPTPSASNPQFPSVLIDPPAAAAPAAPSTAAQQQQQQPVILDPSLPVNTAPQALPPLQPLDKDGNPLPVKRPRGRPRKIPGTESRGPAARKTNPDGTPAVTAGRGRPKGRGRGRGRGTRGKGRGGKRRMSSDEDDFDGDSTSEEEKMEKARGKKRLAVDMDEDESEPEAEVDLNNEVADSFGASGRQTKFGRKISKPKSFVPTNKPTILRKKRAPHLTFEAALMCETCHLGHSPPENRLVICDSCLRGFHQLCAVPLIQAEVVDSPAPWFCGECDAKMAEGRERVDVCEEGKGWTTGQGESKEVETREEEKALVLQQQQLDGTVAGEVAMQVEEEREEDEYAEKHKREWLESLPLKTLVEYVLSIEKKFAPLLPHSSSTSTLPIYPPSLPSLLSTLRLTRLRESLARDAALARAAEQVALHAAEQQAYESTPAASEGGTPLSFAELPGENLGGGARTASSRRAEIQAAEAAAAGNGAGGAGEFAGASSSSSNGNGVASTSTATYSDAHLAAVAAASAVHQHQQQQLQQQQQQQPPFVRAQGLGTPISAFAVAAQTHHDIPVGLAGPSHSHSPSLNDPSSSSSAVVDAFTGYTTADSTPAYGSSNSNSNPYSTAGVYSASSSASTAAAQPGIGVGAAQGVNPLYGAQYGNLFETEPFAGSGQGHGEGGN